MATFREMALVAAAAAEQAAAAAVQAERDARVAAARLATKPVLTDGTKVLLDPVKLVVEVNDGRWVVLSLADGSSIALAVAVPGGTVSLTHKVDGAWQLAGPVVTTAADVGRAVRDGWPPA